MSRAKTFIVTASAGGTTYSPAYPLDIYNNPTDVGIGVYNVTGSALYYVQHTFTDPYAVNLNSSPTAGVWLNNSYLASASTNGDTNYIAPPRAVRLALNAAASATATMTVIQAGRD